MTKHTTATAIEWTAIAGTADFRSADGQWYATYRGTVRGFACYWVHARTLPKAQRTLGRAVVVGGLPVRVQIGVSRGPEEYRP